MQNELTTDEWRERLINAKAAAHQKALEAYIELGKEVHAFRQFCATTRGGTDFTAKATEWLCIDKAALSHLAAVGRRSDELLRRFNSLPNVSTVGLIASLPDDQFGKVVESIEPTMTVAQVKGLIKEAKGEPRPRPVAIEGEVVRQPVADDAVAAEREKIKDTLMWSLIEYLGDTYNDVQMMLERPEDYGRTAGNESAYRAELRKAIKTLLDEVELDPIAGAIDAAFGADTAWNAIQEYVREGSDITIGEWVSLTRKDLPM